VPQPSFTGYWINRFDRRLIQDDGEVLAFHPAWIHPDFNPQGIRIGFMNGEGRFQSAEYSDYKDTYLSDDLHMPIHWMKLPNHPTFTLKPNEL
jgi:hypothetical protein